MPLCLFHSCILIFFLTGPSVAEVVEEVEAAEVVEAGGRTGRLGAVAWGRAGRHKVVS